MLFNLPCISVSFKRKCLFSCLNLSYRDIVLSPLKMYCVCVFAMRNYNDYMQVHHSKSNCHRYIPQSKRQILKTWVLYHYSKSFPVFFEKGKSPRWIIVFLNSSSICHPTRDALNGCPYIQFYAIYCKCMLLACF